MRPPKSRPFRPKYKPPLMQPKARPKVSIDRFAFYGMTREAYAVIQTGERRFYGCFMFRKGVIPRET